MKHRPAVVRRAALLAAVALSTVALAPARAADPEAAADAPLLLAASVTSIDAVNALVADIVGAPTDPARLTTGLGGLVGSFGLGLEADDLATDRPIYVRAGLVGGVSSGLLAVPVKDGHLSVAEMKQAGAEAVAGSDDTVANAGHAYYGRRTGGYLLAAKSAEAATGAAVSADLGSLPKPAGADAVPFPAGAAGTVLTVSTDVAAVRRVVPHFADAMRAFRQSMANQLANLPESDRQAQQVGQNLVLDLVDHQLDRLDLAVMATPADVRLAMVAMPNRLAAPRPCARPAFPAGCVGRVDFDYADREQSRWMARCFKQLVDLQGASADEETKAGLAVMMPAAELFTVADAVSISARFDAANRPVVYVVERFDDAAEAAAYPAKLRKLADQVRDTFNAHHIAGPGDEVKVSTYEQDGKTVTRLYLGTPDDGGCVDAVQDGPVVRLAMSAGADHHLGELLSAGPDQGQLTKVCEATVDVAAAARLATLVPDSPLAKLDDAAKKQLAAVFAGQTAAFSVTPVGPTLRIDLTVPKQMLKNLYGLSQGG